MRKSLLYLAALVSFLFISGITYGQCTPDAMVTDPEGNGEMVPDTLHAVENTPLSQVLTIIAPDTASFKGNTITIHHITLKSLVNKPAWLSYACNTPTCEFYGNASGCALTTGTPPIGSAGIYAIDVLVDVYVLVMSTPVPVATDYNGGMPFVVIVHPVGWGIDEHANDFKLTEPQPNPFINTTKIGVFTQEAQWVQFVVTDITGKTVCSEKIYTVSGENYFQFNGGDLTPGVYFYSVSSEQNRLVSNKLIKGN